MFGKASDLFCKLVGLLGVAVIRSVERIVEHKRFNGRDDHLDAIDGVVCSVVLQTCYCGVKEVVYSRSQRQHKLIARIGRVSEAVVSFAERAIADEVENFVAAKGFRRAFRSEEALTPRR
jgi:hypothetical protein